MRPHALFIGSTYAGWRTRQLNLERHVMEDGRVEAEWRRISGWRDGGWIERLPALPRGLRGRARALTEGASFAGAARYDVVWTSSPEVLAAYAWSLAGPFRRPLILELDWTLAQRESMARAYYGRAPREGLRLRTAEWQQAAAFGRVSLCIAWSNWAAQGLADVGVERRRIRVIPPGVDLAHWRIGRGPRDNTAPLRLLFVGGDFRRKGGPSLVELVAGRFGGRCELDIVTREDVEPAPGVRVHRCEPNSPELLRLYEQADLFVLPTSAECFGIATVEALASGLPVIVTDTGGAGDIVDDGQTGWLIEPGAASLGAALERAIERRAQLPAMGARGREVASVRFDGARNDRLVVDSLLELAGTQSRVRLVPA